MGGGWEGVLESNKFFCYFLEDGIMKVEDAALRHVCGRGCVLLLTTRVARGLTTLAGTGLVCNMVPLSHVASRFCTS